LELEERIEDWNMVGMGGKDRRLEYGWNGRKGYKTGIWLEWEGRIEDWNMVGMGGKDSRLKYGWNWREG